MQPGVLHLGASHPTTNFNKAKDLSVKQETAINQNNFPPSTLLLTGLFGVVVVSIIFAKLQRLKRN